MCFICKNAKTTTEDKYSLCKKCTKIIMNVFDPKIPKKLKKELKLLIPDPINLNSWLNSKNSNLDNKTPLELINEKNQYK